MEPQLKENENVLAAKKYFKKSFTILTKLFGEIEHVRKYS